MNFGLSEKNINLIIGVLTDCGVSKAVIFGSRAKGNFRYNSDIDIAVWGNVNIGHILTELDELPMPYKFDVVSYESLKNDKLREHIDRVGKIFSEKFS
jgi:predicted nucleotidyltransferase